MALTKSPGIPLPTKSNPRPTADSSEIITEATIYTCIASPHPSDIAHLRQTLLETADTTACLGAVRQMQRERGIALADVVTALAVELGQLEVPPQTRVIWLEGLADVESRLAGGGNEMVQAGGLVGVVRTGVEGMERGGFGKGR
jgi:replication factor C subunit 3/5